ncbi:MAG: T9SS type A sorting domain-containing protein [Cytophagaceae bacterium]|nr:T9SS type A sorting domain-containing protein [Cytophagaceae bacterium]
MNKGETFILEYNCMDSEITGIEWLDLSGKIRHIQNVSGRTKSVPDLEKGLYILKIQVSEGFIYRKIFIE